MKQPITPATRLFALLGDPVAHSLSPRFQNAAIAAAERDAIYVALRCASADVPGLVRGIALAGGGGNVTLPHKQTAARSVDRRTIAAERTGACNTFWAADGLVWGDNTDVHGVATAVRSLLGGSVSQHRVLILGAGGSARAALVAMMEEGAREVIVANRTVERARALVAELGNGSSSVRALAFAELTGADAFDLAINATSLGLRDGDSLPLDGRDAPRFTAALDLVYSTSSTPWIRELRKRRVPAADGTEMLLHQGAASYERWWGEPAPIDAMRAALAEAATA